MTKHKRLRLIRRKSFVSRGRKGCVKLAWQREWQVVMKEASKKLQNPFIRWSEYLNLYLHMYRKGTFRHFLPFLPYILLLLPRFTQWETGDDTLWCHAHESNTQIRLTMWLHSIDYTKKLPAFILALPQLHVFEKYSPAVVVGQMPPGVDWVRLWINMSLPQLQTASGLYILISLTFL